MKLYVVLIDDLHLKFPIEIIALTKVSESKSSERIGFLVILNK